MIGDPPYPILQVHAHTTKAGRADSILKSVVSVAIFREANYCQNIVRHTSNHLDDNVIFSPSQAFMSRDTLQTGRQAHVHPLKGGGW
jgi:hypothetical protein